LYDDKELGFFWLQYFAQFRKHNQNVLNRPANKQTFYPSSAFGLLSQLRTVHKHAHQVFVGTDVVHLDSIQVLWKYFPEVIPIAVDFVKTHLANEVEWKGWIEEFNSSQMGKKYRANNSHWWKDWYLRVPSTRFTISPTNDTKNIREGANVCVTLEDGSKLDGRVAAMQAEKGVAFVEIKGVEQALPISLHFLTPTVEPRSRSQSMGKTSDTPTGSVVHSFNRTTCLGKEPEKLGEAVEPGEQRS